MNTRIASTLAALKKNEARILAPFHAAQAIARQKTNERMRGYVKGKRVADVSFRALGTLRCRLYSALRAQGATTARKPGTSAAKRMLGCSVEYLMEYLAVFFAPGMSWENYGEWEIDHVKPCRAFDLSKWEEQFRCFHYTNLQPIWADENKRKCDKWNGLRARDAIHLV